MRKRSHLLEVAILGLLSEQDLHGYELKRRLVDVLGLFSSLSFGSMYPALARLEAEGLVEVSATTGTAGRRGASVPLTGSLGGERAALRSARSLARSGGEARSGRARKVYAITDSGRERFSAFLASAATEGDDDADFKLRLAFARHLPAESRLGLLEQRKAFLLSRLARARRSASVEGELDPYAQSIVEHSTSVTENDINWIETLIATERSRNA
jgi:DNA-binding PadR family transcriptional regulator